MQRCSGSHHGNPGTQPGRTKLTGEKQKKKEREGEEKKKEGKGNSLKSWSNVVRKHRYCGRGRELPLGCSPWDDLQQGDAQCAPSAPPRCLLAPTATIPVKGPSRTWHVPPASSQAGSLRLCCRTGRQHPAGDPGGCKEPFPHPKAALEPQTEETLKVMDRWVSGARLFSTFFLLLAQMDWPSFWVTARHTQHASSGLPILPPHPSFGVQAHFSAQLYQLFALLLPKQSRAACIPLSPQEGILEARPPRPSNGAQSPSEQ